MATKKPESKPSAQSDTVVEYVLRSGKQGVFSHSSEAVVRAKHAQLVTAEQAQGAESANFTLHEKTVKYTLPEGETEVPKGENSNLPGTVSERKLVL
jgi:hypothetical protein